VTIGAVRLARRWRNTLVHWWRQNSDTRSNTTEGARQKPGLDAWLAARILPEQNQIEVETLSQIVDRHLSADNVLARVDTALRDGVLDPFGLSITGNFDEALVAPLRQFLKMNLRLQRELGLSFELESGCGSNPSRMTGAGDDDRT